MLHVSYAVEENDISDLIGKLQVILCLHHWRIKYKLESGDKMKQSLMKIVPNRDRNIATIFIRESLVGKPMNEFGPLLLHELMHLVLEPVVEEHTFQLQYEVSEERLKEYQCRFRRPLEKVVEHLTSQLAPLITFAVAAEEAKEKLDEHTLSIQQLRSDNEYLKILVEQTIDLLLPISKALKEQGLVIDDHKVGVDWVPEDTTVS